jgi:type II secretory pathway component PulF
MKTIFWPYSNIQSDNFSLALQMFKIGHLISVVVFIFGLLMIIPPIFTSLFNGEIPGIGVFVRSFMYLIYPFLLFTIVTIGGILISIENTINKAK